MSNNSKEEKEGGKVLKTKTKTKKNRRVGGLGVVAEKSPGPSVRKSISQKTSKPGDGSIREAASVMKELIQCLQAAQTFVAKNAAKDLANLCKGVGFFLEENNKGKKDKTTDWSMKNNVKILASFEKIIGHPDVRNRKGVKNLSFTQENFASLEDEYKLFKDENNNKKKMQHYTEFMGLFDDLYFEYDLHGAEKNRILELDNDHRDILRRHHRQWFVSYYIGAAIDGAKSWTVERNLAITFSSFRPLYKSCIAFKKQWNENSEFLDEAYRNAFWATDKKLIMKKMKNSMSVKEFDATAKFIRENPEAEELWEGDTSIENWKDCLTRKTVLGRTFYAFCVMKLSTENFDFLESIRGLEQVSTRGNKAKADYSKKYMTAYKDMFEVHIGASSAIPPNLEAAETKKLDHANKGCVMHLS